MSTDFLNGMVASKIQLIMTLLSEIQAVNTKEIEVATMPHLKTLSMATVALMDIHSKLRESCKK